MDNVITIIGNLTRDPELRFTATGVAVASLGVAVNNRYQVNGTWETKVSFFDVIAWKQLGENAAQSFHKGDRVVVHGRMDQRVYETQAGDRRSVLELVALDIAASVRFATVDGITKINQRAEAPAEAEALAEPQPV